MMSRHAWMLIFCRRCCLLWILCLGTSVWAQAPVRIALIETLSGPLAAGDRFQRALVNSRCGRADLGPRLRRGAQQSVTIRLQ